MKNLEALEPDFQLRTWGKRQDNGDTDVQWNLTNKLLKNYMMAAEVRCDEGLVGHPWINAGTLPRDEQRTHFTP